MSYIKRKDAKDAIFDYICEQTVSKYPSDAECKSARHGAEGAFNEIDYVPTADVVEVRHGEWGFDGIGWTCSECSEYGDKQNKYCPHCGAKMDMKLCWNYCYHCGEKIKVGDKCFYLANGDVFCTKCVVLVDTAEEYKKRFDDGEERKDDGT